MHKHTTDTQMLTKSEEDNTQKTTTKQMMMMHVNGRDNGTDMRSKNSTDDANKVMRLFVRLCIYACRYVCCHTKLTLY